MNILTLKKLAAAITVACSLAFASTSNAALIELTTVVGGPDNNPYYLGSIDDGISASVANETAWVNYLTTMTLGDTDPFSPNPTGNLGDVESLYRSLNNFAGLPLVLTTDQTKFEEDELENPISLTGAVYILGKYGKGSGAQISHVWYVGNLPGVNTFTLPGQALSHISVWGGSVSVPDSASTLVLIGLGLTSLCAVSRRRRNL